MLDALVAEARLRWGLDPAAGLQVVAAERLVATPIEASRPVIVVPLAMLRPGAVEPDATRSAAAPGPARAARPDPLGRPGPGSTRPDHPVGRFGSAAERDRGGR